MAQICRQSAVSFGAKIQNHLKKLIRTASYGSRYHEFRLRGKHPLRLLGTPVDPWTGSETAGLQILSGQFYFQGRTLVNPARNGGLWAQDEIWRTRALSRADQRYLHSFCWLRDVNRVPDRKATRDKTIALIRYWLEDFDHWQDLVWAPDIIGQRLFSWLAYAPLILDSHDLVYRSKLLNCLARQARHLYHVGDGGLRGRARIQAVSGLMLAGLYLPYGESWLKKARVLLNRALAEEIFADGGVSSRNPEDLYAILRELLVIRASCRAMGHEISDILGRSIHRMIVMLDMLRHGDGGLALFNGATEGKADDIAATIAFAGGSKNNTLEAVGEKSGFRRLQRGATVIIFDSGPPADIEVSQNCHAGTLSFEMSDGPRRIIVNCGSATTDSADDLYRLCRSTAAHSTVIVADRNSSEIRKDDLIGRGPTRVISRFNSPAEGPGLIEADHDGYLSRFGLIHSRTLYINETGDDVRGEDILQWGNLGQNPARKQQAATTFDVRFHLHPAVTLTRQTASDRLLLSLSGAHYWQFYCSGGQMAVAESLYLGDGVHVRGCQQIIVSGTVSDKKTVIKWSLRRRDHAS
ncbi:MAG: hypothetical protein GXP02_03580 [Alphaproteobacteria bacterium]|nr:hypothetical protein [Alphaproteobacteria bacterium]